ncbi:hypothetical protein [Bacillus sp. FJAT-27245]|uniref:hypothetical protein n=1 Tax=Bacillus sp. FJAT-27245 TaxID=1684144 RepID=UPI0006A7DE1C|nr:hypothetical protein [Bacillus sp. FJAT-27245]
MKMASKLIVGNKVKLPTPGLVRFAKSRILNATIRHNQSGKYFVSFLTKKEIKLLDETGSIVVRCR